MSVRFTKPRAAGGLCWHCDRQLYAGGRSYVMVLIHGHERPVHDFCATGYERAARLDIDPTRAGTSKEGE